MSVEIIKCLWCGKEVASSVPRRKYCDEDCARSRNRVLSREYQRVNGCRTGIPKNRTCEEGAIHELLVHIDLLRKGWKVFAPSYATKGVDLVALKGNTLLRVQVKKAQFNSKTGTMSAPSSASKYREMYDILALSFDGEQVVYRPPLPEVRPLPGGPEEEGGEDLG
jgi:hypothetical protein